MEINERDFFFALSMVLKTARKEKHMTQAELADCAFLNKSYICDIERGKRNPSVSVLLKLTKALSISLSVLMLRVEYFLKEGTSV